MICLYCNKEITDPWVNQLRHKPCNRKFRADTIRAKRLAEREERLLCSNPLHDGIVSKPDLV
jgi:hypothetical protein